MAIFSRFTPSGFARIALALWLSSPFANVQAFNTDTHAPLTEMAARHYQCEVEGFLIGQLRETKGLRSLGEVDSDVTVYPIPPRWVGRYTYTYLDALKLGAIDEDSEQGAGVNLSDSIPDTWRRRRMGNHFYCPSRNKKGFDDEAFIGNYRLAASAYSWFTGEEVPSVDSLHWAWDNRGAVSTTRGDEHYGWIQARDHYTKWLTTLAPSERQWHAGETFYALGHVIHLVQDLAQPQHTRNDGHSQPQWYGVFHVGDNAFLEKFCSEHFDSIEELKTLPGPPPIPVFAQLPKTREDGIPIEFRAFWDTDQLFFPRGNRPDALPDQRNGYTGDLGLAEYSNAFFVTSDTMFTDEPPLQIFRDLSGTSCTVSYRIEYQPQHIFRWPKLAELSGFSLVPVLPSSLRYGLHRLGERVPPEGQWPSLNVFRLNPAIPDYCSISFSQVGSPYGINVNVGLTEKNLAAQAKALLPKAIAYSAGMLNYFFRGRLKMEFLYPDTPGNPQIKITNLTTNESVGSGEALGSGQFTLLREDPVTTIRSVVWEWWGFANNGGPQPATLPFGQSFTAPLPYNMPRDGKLILVFKGTIGNEKDIAIAAVVSPGLCGNFELLANGGTNSGVDAGELISFERCRLNADGTRTNVPVTVNSWGGESATWPGTPINGLSETGHHTSYAFMNWGDGRLVAQRRGTWTLRPNGGGCVTVVVKNDLVMIQNQTSWANASVECAIDGVSLGSIPSLGNGNGLGKTLSTILGGPASVFRLPIQSGQREMVLKAGPGAGDFVVGFFGGISSPGPRFNLGIGQTMAVPLTVPAVPGDPPVIP